MTRSSPLLVFLFLNFSVLNFSAEWAWTQGKVAAPPAVVPHEEFALQYLDDHGLAGSERESIEFEALLEGEFIRFDLGLYDLRFPFEDLAEPESADNFRELALALLRSQELFAAWVEADDDKQIRSDLKTLKKWVGGWKAKSFKSISVEKPAHLAPALKAKPKTLEALTRFANWMRTGKPVQLNRAHEQTSRILFMPTRPRFLKFVCFAGWLYPDLKSNFWDDGLGTWLGCRVQQTQVIALQYASPKISEADFELGLPLNYRHETVMQQHAVHFGTQALFDNYFRASFPGFASTGLAMNLVLEQFGELNTRIEGDLRARFTESFSVFVPGGNPSGGTLPPYNPDGRWRQNYGVDHFIDMLQKAQKSGNDHVRNAKERNLKFEILSEDTKDKIGLVAPFLGKLSLTKELPEEKFLGDYQEFYRAYKCAFVWWVQTVAGGSKSRSAKAFAQILLEQGRNPALDLDSILLETYGFPISEERPGKSSLEGQFLAWLAKQ